MFYSVYNNRRDTNKISYKKALLHVSTLIYGVIKHSNDEKLLTLQLINRMLITDVTY